MKPYSKEFRGQKFAVEFRAFAILFWRIKLKPVRFLRIASLLKKFRSRA